MEMFSPNYRQNCEILETKSEINETLKYFLVAFEALLFKHSLIIWNKERPTLTFSKPLFADIILMAVLVVFQSLQFQFSSTFLLSTNIVKILFVCEICHL